MGGRRHWTGFRPGITIRNWWHSDPAAALADSQNSQGLRRSLIRGQDRISDKRQMIAEFPHVRDEAAEIFECRQNFPDAVQGERLLNDGAISGSDLTSPINS